jgi:bis(5'-nucleosyl)-tetraphosphatase (symmetrical)
VACYVVGDVHGCLEQLKQLMSKINYASSDRVIFLGDYVGRGPDSLGVIQYLRSLENAVCILGNHDLHLLYDYFVKGDRHPINPDFYPIFSSNEAEDMMQWVRSLPLTHSEHQAFFVHAGLYPGWSVSIASALSHEACELLRGDSYKRFLSNMYGNFPNRWDPELKDIDRFRFILNACTRMRYLTTDGLLDFTENQPPSLVKDKVPWYQNLQSESVIYFGHWASLEGKVHTRYVHSLDGGCVWGGRLMAMNIETGERFEVQHG